MRKRAYSGRQDKQVNVAQLVQGRDGQPAWTGSGWPPLV